MTELYAISPIDGRYKNSIKELQDYFSEFALIKYRIFIEIEYFIHLAQSLPELQTLTPQNLLTLQSIYQTFSDKDAKKVKQIEKRTNHDVKSVEYFLRDKFTELGFHNYKEYIHFGLTSQDINSSANMLQIKNCIQHVYLKNLQFLLDALMSLANLWNIVILGKTHGQPASPTILGKEILVFCERLNKEVNILNNINYSTKFGGAVGNFNAHIISCPEVDWLTFADKFTSNIGLIRNKYTTQIDHYDNYAQIFDSLRRINTVLIDFDRDMWTYISNNYFNLKIVQNEVGSSAMPHKVNPIQFELSEGNLMLANNLLNFMSNKLPISRMQRDLTDSTVLRNVGTAFGHTLIGIKAILKGLNRVEPNLEVIERDLSHNWMVISEGIQTILRRSGYLDAYEALKQYTRTGEVMNKDRMDYFINNLEIDDILKERLLSITPFNYFGIVK